MISPILLFLCSATAVIPPDSFMLSQGVAVTEMGRVVVDHSSVLIPAVVKLGDFSHWFHHNEKDECSLKLKQRGDLIQAQLESLIQSNVGSIFLSPNKLSRRYKRFSVGNLLLGLGAGFMGNWLYESFASHNTQKAINHIEDHLASLIHRVNDLQHDILLQDENLKHIWSHTIKNRAELVSIHKSIDCMKQDTDLSFISSIMLSSIPNQFHRAITALLSGLVTPDLLGYNQAFKLLLHHPELQNSLYISQIGYFYQVADSIPIHVDSTKGTIVYLLRVPILRESNTGTLMRVHNFGMRKGPKMVRHIIPPHLTIFPDNSTQGGVFGVAMEHCRKMGGMTICPEFALRMGQDTECFLSLSLNHTTHGCHQEMKTPLYDPVLLDTGLGVFVMSDKFPITLYNQSHGRKSSTVMAVEQDVTSRWIPYTLFDGMVVGPYHIDGQHGENPEMVLMPHIVDMTLNNGSTVSIRFDDWAPVSVHAHTDLPEYVHTAPIWMSIGVTVVVSLVVSMGVIVSFLLCLYRWKIQRCQGDHAEDE